MKPSLFIGSSVEGVRIAYAAQQNLRLGAEVTVWDQGVFQLSKTSLESLLAILDATDFGMFVFSPDDIVTIRGEESRAVRDNVLFELGLFVGRLGRERSFILIPENATDLRFPTDLLGITPATYEVGRRDGSMQAATAPACHSVREAIEKLGRRPDQQQAPSVGPERRDENKSEASALEEPTESTAEKAKSNEPSNYKWLFAYFQRDYTGAIALLEEQIALQPEGDERIDLESWRGRAQYRVDPTAGTTSLETLIAKHPSRPEPYFHLAFAHRDRDLPEDALRAFDRGLTAASGRHELVSGKVSLLCDLGRDENAIALLREGISDNSTHAPYYHQLAEILKAKNQGAEALRVVEEGLEAAPENEDLLSFYVTELFEGPDKKLALVPYNRLVALQPSNPSYLTLRGNLYLDLELHDSAMCAYKQANELAQGKQGWILANIGNLYKNRGFFTDGIDYLKKALVIAPNDDYAHQRLGLSLELLRKEQEQLQSLVKEARQILAAQRATRKTAGA